jgi:tetratricopeptide (TPR) repeat protein
VRYPLAPRAALLCLLTTLALPAPTAAAQPDRKPVSLAEYERGRAETLGELARQKRYEEMAFARELLGRGAVRGETRAELLLRLADLYLEEARDMSLEEEQAFQADFDRCVDDPACNPDGLTVDRGGSTKWYEEAVDACELILQGYPTWRRADEASYFAASAWWSLDRRSQAVAELTRLVRAWPDSALVPDAYLLIGEHYFDREQVYKALVAYKKAAAFGDWERAPLARYKLAWCYFNVGEYGEAIAGLEAVIRRSQADPGAAWSMREEALKDLVRFHADAGDLAAAVAAIRALVPGDQARPMLRSLAGAMEERGMDEAAVRLYRELLSEDPRALDAPELQDAIADRYLAQDRPREALAELERLRRGFGPGSAWAAAAGAEAGEAAMALLEEDLRKAATGWHQQARRQGPGGDERYAAAQRAYELYAESFPDSARAYDVTYGHAELLYERGQYGPAFARYMDCVAADPAGRHARFCASSAVHAAKARVGAEAHPPAPAPAPGQAPQPAALSAAEEDYLAALDQHARLFPQAEESHGMRYTAGYLLYDHSRFAEASEQFAAVIAADPASREAGLAVELTLDSLALVGEWRRLEDLSWRFYQQEGLGAGPDFKQGVLTVHQRARLKQVEVALEQTGDERAAAAGLLAFVADFPQAGDAPLALHNAAAHLASLGDIAGARDARLALVEGYPGAERYADAVAALGYDYEQLADFASAAAWYERLFRLYPEREDATDAIYSAAALREALGDRRGAIEDLQKYLAAAPEAEDADAVALSVGRLYAEAGDHQRAARVYRVIFEGEAAPEALLAARLGYGAALRAAGDREAALAHYTESVVAAEAMTFEQPEAAAEAVAEMLYALAEHTRDRYQALPLDGPAPGAPPEVQDRVAADQVLAKGRALLDLRNQAAAILETGSGRWGVAALALLGEGHEHMALALRGAFVPTYLSAEQAELYRALLNDRAGQQEILAVEVYSAAFDKARQLALYTPAALAARARLAALAPEDWPPAYEELPEVALPAQPEAVSTCEPAR